MNKKLCYGVGMVAVVFFKIIVTIVMQVKPEIVNTTITGIAFGAGVVLIFWGREQARVARNTSVDVSRAQGQ